MQQIFDEHLYTSELTETLQKIQELGLQVTITPTLLTTTEFFNIIKEKDPYLYLFIYTKFSTHPYQIYRCNSIKEAIKNKTLLPIPYITPTRIVDTAPVDGCHRMYVCEQLFEPDTKFPVLVITPTKKEDIV